MDALFFTNLTSPPLLFFLLGALASLLRSDLEIPEQIAKFLSLYLLMAIGFKGGVALSESDLDLAVLTGLSIALVMSIVVPVYVFFLVKRTMTLADAAATAATFGSISAVTFVTCTSYLDANQIEWSGYLVAAMALMESPAIIIGLLFYKVFQDSTVGVSLNARDLINDSLLNGSVFLIVGSLVVGWISGPEGKVLVAPFLQDLFIGVLCLFLLDMGIVAMRRLMDLRLSGSGLPIWQIAGWGIVLPLINAALALFITSLFTIGEGDVVLLLVLSASASYIAVPAAMRLALPEANPGTYLGIALGITFPFNLVIGIPLYHYLAVWAS
ncbi:MAG: hypothetical protein ACJAYE_003090 [Candidatus Azotimanducaceae bacterium]